MELKKFHPAHLSTVRVASLIRNVRTHKDTDPDGVTAHLLEVTADEAAVGLQLIFRRQWRHHANGTCKSAECQQSFFNRDAVI